MRAPINQGGGGPCHITLSDDGKYLITANYGSGSVSLVRLNSSGIPERVSDVIFYGDKSHPHMTLYNKRTQIYYVSDLGLDRIHRLRLDTTIGKLMTDDVPYLECEKGSGPRHMLIDKSSSNLYVINELNSTMSVFNILSDTTDIRQTVSTLPEGYGEKSFCADIHFSANEKKIYGSNRGHNSIVTFRVGAGGKTVIRGIRTAAATGRVILPSRHPANISLWPTSVQTKCLLSLPETIRLETSLRPAFQCPGMRPVCKIVSGQAVLLSANMRFSRQPIT